MNDLEDEQSWHPDGADLSGPAIGALLAVLVGPVLLAVWLLAAVL